MKKILVIGILFSISLKTAVAQKKVNEIKIQLSGFVRNDMVYNTRQVLSGRGEALVYLLPKPVKLDKEGMDINAVDNFNLTAISTRIRNKIIGGKIWNANITASIEADFIGANRYNAFMLRLRHAYIKLNWSKNHIIVGQYWHSLWSIECYPSPVSYGAAIPFNPLARVPQIRFTQDIGAFKVIGTLMSSGMFKGKTSGAALQNAIIPELNAQIQYKSKKTATGAGINYKRLTPRIRTDSNYATTQTLNNVSYFIYLKHRNLFFTAKTYVLYGQSNDNAVLMGGYAVENKKYSEKEIQRNNLEYEAYNTLNLWVDIESNTKTIKYGIFVGYSKNLGSSKKILVETFTGRWGNIASMYKIAPRIKYPINKLSLCFELDYTVVQYAEEGNDKEIYDDFGRVIAYHQVSNLKPTFTIIYSF